MSLLPSLWEDALKMPDRFERLFGDLTGEGLFGTALGRADIYEKDNALHYDIELPGLSKDDISVRIENDRLIVKGEIQRDEEVNTDDYLHMGRRYGRFQRTFPVPPEVEKVESIKARFDNGVLRISLPLKESLRGQIVDVDIE
ncbi:MAG: Hsp20/alpha crystallin family protein [Bacillota bacterium]